MKEIAADDHALLGYLGKQNLWYDYVDVARKQIAVHPDSTLVGRFKKLVEKEGLPLTANGWIDEPLASGKGDVEK